MDRLKTGVLMIEADRSAKPIQLGTTLLPAQSASAARVITAPR
jgi:hypothetical protein